MGWIVPLATAVYGAYTAYQQSQASKQAANLQAGASAEAIAEAKRQFNTSMDFSERQYADASNMMAPYVKTGQQSIVKLAHLSGMPGVTAGNWSPYQYTGRYANPSAPIGTGGPTTPDPRNDKNASYEDKNAYLAALAGTSTGMPTDSTTLADLGTRSTLGYEPGTMYPTTFPEGVGPLSKRNPKLNRQQTQFSYKPLGVGEATGGGDTEMVRMTSPDGSQQDVDPSQVDYYTALGWTVSGR